MDESPGFWRRFGGKLSIRALLVAMVVLFIASFPNILPPSLSKLCMMIAELLLAGLIIWAAYIYQVKPQGSYISDRYPAELDLLAQNFEKKADSALQAQLQANLKQVNPLYLGLLYSLSVERFSEECSTRRELATDQARFYLFAQKANFEAQSDNFALAEKCVQQALAIEPHAFILWLRLAEISERLGKGKEAISAYASALEQAPDKPEIKEYLRQQIQYVQSHGPRKELPLQGLTYGSV